MPTPCPAPWPLTNAVARKVLGPDQRFTLVDVGCSGGLHVMWRGFGERLRALGIDARLGECERLAALEDNPHVSYATAIVGLPPETGEAFDLAGNFRRTENFLNRSSTAAMYEIFAARAAKGEDVPIKELLVEHAYCDDPALSLDALLEREGLSDVDFLKVDVDGCDLSVLQSGPECLASQSLLGAFVEVNFFGSADPRENSFHNIDRLMRENGFELFDLGFRRYSSRHLPRIFCTYPMNHTTQGRVVQGDALYLRDWGIPANRAQALEAGPTQILKLACCCELYGLADSAAELLVLYRDVLEPLANVDGLLDLLVPEDALGRRPSHAAYLREFYSPPYAARCFDDLPAEHHRRVLRHLDAWAKTNPGSGFAVFGANVAGAKMRAHGEALGLSFLGYGDNFIRHFDCLDVLSADRIAMAGPRAVVIASMRHEKDIRAQLQGLPLPKSCTLIGGSGITEATT